MVACGEAVAQQVAGEHQQVHELDFSGPFAVLGIFEGKAFEQLEHRDQGRRLLGIAVGRRVECCSGQQIVVVVEADRDVTEVLQGHAHRERGAQRVLRRGVVQRHVEPLRPAVFECDLGCDLVAGGETGRQARFERALAQEAAGEAVKRLDGGQVELFDGAFAVRPLFLAEAAVFGGPFQGFADAAVQLGGGSLGKGDGGDAAHFRPARLDECGDAVDEAAGFAGAGPRHHDHVLVEVMDDRVARGLVGRGDHGFASPSASAA